jgi:hypothetical protein
MDVGIYGYLDIGSSGVLRGRLGENKQPGSKCLSIHPIIPSSQFPIVPLSKIGNRYNFR